MAHVISTFLLCFFVYLFFYALFLRFIEIDVDNTDYKTLLFAFVVWPVFVVAMLFLCLIYCIHKIYTFVWRKRKKL